MCRGQQYWKIDLENYTYTHKTQFCNEIYLNLRNFIDYRDFALKGNIGDDSNI